MTPNSSAIERLRAAGKRVTPERELLVRIINRNPHLDAAEIYRIARDQQPRIGLATVYRTLNLLRELGVVRASGLGEGHWHYEVQQDDHVHLVCCDCGRVIEVPSPAPIRDLATAKGFDVQRVRLELIGYCKDCAKKRSAKSGQDA